MKFKAILLSVVLFTHFTNLYGANTVNALPYLRMGVGARPLGMGGAFTAVSDDSNAVYWNPAGLGRLSIIEVDTMYSLLSLDRSLNYLSAAIPIKRGEYGAFGLGAVVSGVTGIKVYKENEDISSSSFDSSDIAALLSYGKSVGDLVYAGGSLKMLTGTLDTNSYTGYGLDMGVLSNPYRTLWVALNIQDIYTNINWKNSEDKVPSSVTGGLSYRMLDEKLTASVSVKKVESRKDFIYMTGLEMRLPGTFAVRVGMNDGEFSSGISFGIKYFVLDYAFATDSLGEGDKHIVSAGFRFGKEGNTRKENKGSSYSEEQEPVISVTPVRKEEKEEKSARQEMTQEEKKKTYSKAVEYYKNGEYGKAISEWEKILAADPDHKQSKESIEKARAKLK